MIGTMRPFQVILLGIFLALGIGGILVFALFKGFNTDPNPYGAGVVIWGTLDDAPFIAALEVLRSQDENASVISYVEKDPRTFEQELLNALAEGRGPDLVIFPQDMLLQNRAKIMPVSYEQFPIRTFKDTYIDGAEIFLGPEGVYALPVAVDPLLLYFNRDIFSSNSLSRPPRTWEEMLSVVVPTIAQISDDRTVVRPALSFGEYANVRNAKDILAMLFIQAGSEMVVVRDGRVQVLIDTTKEGIGLPPAFAALRFYTEFSNPNKDVYTWDRSMTLDRTAFLAGDLAMYVGFASEYEGLVKGNPNLMFDITELPQGADVQIKKGYGRFYGMALMRNSQNLAGAYQALFALSGMSQSAQYAEMLRIGPVHRSTLTYIPQDPILSVVARGALIARGWLDPSPALSHTIFRQMVEDVTSGRQDVSGAVRDAEGRLRQLVGG